MSEEQKSSQCVCSEYEGKVGKDQPHSAVPVMVKESGFYFMCPEKPLGGFKVEVA